MKIFHSKEIMATREKTMVLGVPHRVIYTNWKGETRERTIIPIKFFFGETQFHKGEQWFVRALDKDKQQVRDFAIADMKPNWD